jgi:hypothetical protein
MKRYYIGEPPESPRGPFYLHELSGLFRESQLSLDTPVIEEGASAWGRYGDLRTGERTREVAGAMADKAAKVVAALHREESKSFSFGFLLGVLHLLMLPWQLIRGAAATVAQWGSSRFIAVSEGRLASAVIGKVAQPVCILLWTAYWVGDCISLLLVGKPAVTLFLVSSIGNLVLTGTPAAGASALMDISFGFLRIPDFGDRVIWMGKLAFIGYGATVVLAIVGEFFDMVAAAAQRDQTQQFRTGQ